MDGQLKKIARSEKSTFYFDKEVAPIIKVNSGDEILIGTRDANAGLIRKETDIYTDFNVLYAKAGGANPVAGPIYVDGAHPGDCLRVKILDIQCGGEIQQGYTALYSIGLGGLTCAHSLQGPIESRTKIYQLSLDSFKFPTGKRNILVPLSPFIGTIGVAPKYERRMSFYHGKEFCGNIDCRDVSKGKEVMLPVHVDGALFSLGDVHAAQGDGEITGCALETEGEVRIRVEAIPCGEAEYCDLPQVNCEEWIGSVGCPDGSNLGDAVRMGYLDLIERMHKFYGYDKYDAYQLLGLVGEVSVGQVVDPLYSCVVKIKRRYLE